MSQLQLEAPQSTLGVDDFLFAVFKHKKKLLFFSILGLIAAYAVYSLSTPVYESEAKLLVRYVLERSTVDPAEAASEGAKTTDNVINSEIEILTSWDLAVQVAETLGVKRLLPETPKAAITDAASVVRGGLEARSFKGSSIIYVTYRNQRPELATQVLEEIVNRYFTKHLEVHRSAGAFDFVTQQTDQVRSRLTQTEDALRALKNKLGIISLQDTTTALSGEMARIMDAAHISEAEQIEQEARVKMLEGSSTDADSKQAARQAGAPSVALVQKYQALVGRLAGLRGTELELLLKYRPGNVLVKLTQTQIEDLETQKHELEKRFPEIPAIAGGNADKGAPTFDLATEKGRLAAMTARTDMMRSRLRYIQQEAKKLADVAPQLQTLERNRELEEINYKYFENTLSKARIDEALDPSKMPNISAVQKPTPPFRVLAKRNKVALELAAGGVGLGLALAFLLELILNRTIKRPAELEKRLRAPVLLSIPYQSRNGHSRFRLKPRKRDKTLAVTKDPAKPDPAPWEENHFIRSYCEAIRDRFGLYFERNHMTHKPKLIGVTGFAEGAGASTLAAGLAAAFSEMGEGKVLLVDANLGSGEVHPFFKGRPAGSLMKGLHAADELAPAADNLYLATVSSPNANTSQLGLKKFFDLMPNLKASDFDYIIFDMPPLGQTSPTMGMAGFMDKVLLVVEAEKNDRELVRRGHADLVAGRDNVSLVFNKGKSYGPKWLHGDS